MSPNPCGSQPYPTVAAEVAPQVEATIYPGILAVQLALYVDLLNRLGFENNRLGKVIDIRSKEVEYDLNSPIGKKDTRSLWDFYDQVKTALMAGRPVVTAIIVQRKGSAPRTLGTKLVLEESGDFSGSVGGGLLP